MLREISDSRYIDIPGSNRYSIVMQPDELRADAMHEILKPWAMRERKTKWR